MPIEELLKWYSQKGSACQISSQEKEDIEEEEDEEEEEEEYDDEEEVKKLLNRLCIYIRSI